MLEHLVNTGLAWDILKTFSPEKYPHLYRVFYQERGTLGGKLATMFNYILSNGTLSAEDTGWTDCTSVSIRQLVAAGRGSAQTWGGLLAQLSGWGLVEKQIPIPGTPAGNEAIKQREIQKQRRGLGKEDSYALIMWYHVPAWTDDLLTAADTLAAQYIPTGKMSKTAAILTYGQKIADKMYPDERTIPGISERIMAEIDKAAARYLESVGYFYPEQILSAVRQRRIKDKGQEIRKSKIKSTFNSYERDMKSKYSLVYRPPTAAEKTRLGLKGRRWIYTRNTGDVPFERK